MNKNFLVSAILIVCLFTGVSVFARFLPQQSNYADNIASFFIRMATVYSENKDYPDVLFQKLSVVNSGGCPPRFRAAYNDFCYAGANFVKYAKQKDAISSGNNVAGTIILSLFMNSSKPIENAIDDNTELGRKMRKAQEDAEDAMQKMSSLAIEYGYDPDNYSTKQQVPPINSSGNLSSIPGKFPQASEKLLTFSDLYGMNKQNLKIMRNEIFARHGYIFKTQEMKSYFSQQPWYHQQYDNVNNMLSNIEIKNIELIKTYE